MDEEGHLVIVQLMEISSPGSISRSATTDIARVF